MPAWSSLGRAAAGGVLAAAATAAIAWSLERGLEAWWAAGAAALVGAAAGWWSESRLHAPLRRLVAWLDARPAEGAAAAAAAGAERMAELAAGIDRLASGLGGRVAELEEESLHQREILAAMSDGVLLVDGELRVELVNPAFQALFGAGEPAVGRPVLELTRSPALVGFLEELGRGSWGGDRRRTEGGSGPTLELRGRRLTGGRLVVVARDVSEQLRLDETRRDLVANVSHELRTPLAAIQGYAENLQEGALEQPEVAGRFVERILAQCRRLGALLEDLLALSRLERAEEAAPADWESVDLAALVERSVETVRGLAAERVVRLDLRPLPVPPIAGNAEALERMLLNLLENAIKYNREGGSVAVSLAAGGDGQIVIEVADTGIGVPQRDLKRIFERFYRVDSGRSREEGGTGLGLAIVKHAAQLHGGRVEVESELGKGSVFRICLPIREGTGPQERAGRGMETRMEERGAGVLVLCTGNSCRSQMAEAFLRRHARGRLRILSAGTEPAPEVHPLARRVMAEVGLDLEGQYPKDYRQFLGRLPISYLITVCDGAAEACPTVWPGVLERCHWPTEDPAGFVGDEDETLEKFRQVRDELEAKVSDWLERLGGEPGRSDGEA